MPTHEPNMTATRNGGASADNNAIARRLAQAFDSPIKVFAHHDDDGPLSVDIFYGPDSPVSGVTSYGTLGLSDFPLKTPHGRADFGLELVGACASDVEFFPNMLATAAMRIIGGAEVFPGAIFEGAVRVYGVSSSMTSLCLVHPFLWKDDFLADELSSKKVAWLQAIPISDAERVFASERGFEALSQRFQDHQIDVYDIHRQSVV